MNHPRSKVFEGAPPCELPGCKAYELYANWKEVQAAFATEQEARLTLDAELKKSKDDAAERERWISWTESRWAAVPQRQKDAIEKALRSNMKPCTEVEEASWARRYEVEVEEHAATREKLQKAGERRDYADALLSELPDFYLRNIEEAHRKRQVLGFESSRPGGTSRVEDAPEVPLHTTALTPSAAPLNYSQLSIKYCDLFESFQKLHSEYSIIKHALDVVVWQLPDLTRWLEPLVDAAANDNGVPTTSAKKATKSKAAEISEAAVLAQAVQALNDTGNIDIAPTKKPGPTDDTKKPDKIGDQQQPDATPAQRGKDAKGSSDV